ncbi:MAG: pantothenate kinase [Merismopedia sp. SIO2A8]|nr:pantothenate kinase [Merismopedia sp. SIO2A8]
MIGNSRLHWAWIKRNIDDDGDDSGNNSGNGDGNDGGKEGDRLPKFPFTIQRTWDTQHFKAQETTPETAPETTQQRVGSELEKILDFLATNQPAFVIASVVPSQTSHWQSYPNAKTLTLDDITLTHLYPTLGIDRALAVLGAWCQWQRPVLVIDGGTALTFTGVNRNGQLIGGAILPGLGLQLRSLHQHTAALPHTWLQEGQIPRWSNTTPGAIRSGIWYTLLAGIRGFIQDWYTQFPDSAIVFTGGDGALFHRALQSKLTGSAEQVEQAELINPILVYDPHVIFKGMAIASKPPLE